MSLLVHYTLKSPADHDAQTAAMEALVAGLKSEGISGDHYSCFTTDEPMVRELLTDNPQAMRFFVGYAGWGPGQLENELNLGGWPVTQAHADVVFDPDADDGLWMRVITGIDRSLAMLAMNPKLMPHDPSMN